MKLGGVIVELEPLLLQLLRLGDDHHIFLIYCKKSVILFPYFDF